MSDFYSLPAGDTRKWISMQVAPTDGREVILLLRHQNWRYCKTDAERSKWEQEVTAKWIDFNGGGWTWRGMCGEPICWREPSPTSEDSGSLFI